MMILEILPPTVFSCGLNAPPCHIKDFHEGDIIISGMEIPRP